MATKTESRLLTPEQYRAELMEQLAELNEVCSETWGQAPDLEPSVIPAMLVRCDFDLGDFPHKGKSLLVHADNARRRTPAHAAREIMREVLTHRNLCNRCGVPVKHIRLRAFEAEKALKAPWNYSGESIERPDAPEELLFPRDSKKLTEALNQLGIR